VADARVKIQGIVLGDPEVGRWCESCLLPSAALVTIGMITNQKPVGVTQLLWCECGTQRGL
jgi:hypothetical protein